MKWSNNPKEFKRCFAWLPVELKGETVWLEDYKKTGWWYCPERKDLIQTTGKILTLEELGISKIFGVKIQVDIKSKGYRIWLKWWTKFLPTTFLMKKWNNEDVDFLKDYMKSREEYEKKH